MKLNAYRFYFFFFKLRKHAVIERGWAIVNHSSYLLLFVLFTISLSQARADATLRYLLFRFEIIVLVDSFILVSWIPMLVFAFSKWWQVIASKNVDSLSVAKLQIIQTIDLPALIWKALIFVNFTFKIAISNDWITTSIAVPIKSFPLSKIFQLGYHQFLSGNRFLVGRKLQIVVFVLNFSSLTKIFLTRKTRLDFFHEDFNQQGSNYKRYLNEDICLAWSSW